MKLEIRGPRVVRAPEARRIEGPGGSVATLSVAPGADGGLRLERHVRVPLAAIGTADYAAFASFCRATTQLESAPIVFAPR